MRFEYPISSPKVKSGCNKNALRFPLELPRCTIELPPRTCPFTSGHPSETLSNFFRYISIVGRSILPAPTATDHDDPWPPPKALFKQLELGQEVRCDPFDAAPIFVSTPTGAHRRTYDTGGLVACARTITALPLGVPAAVAGCFSGAGNHRPKPGLRALSSSRIAIAAAGPRCRVSAVLPGLRSESRDCPCAHLAAGCAPGGAQQRLGVDVGNRHQDRHLRHGAGVF